MWWRCWVCLLAAILAGCATTARAPVGDRARLSHTPAYHTVQQGDTLYSVAFLYGFSVDEIASWNGLQPPYTIYKRQRLRLSPLPKPRTTRKPVPASRPKTVVASRPKPQRQNSKPVAASRPKTTVKPARKTVTARTPPPAIPSGPLVWSWPAEGKLISRFQASRPGKKGIDIAGKSGQSVRAAASGKVVYSGSGLSGYGRLIIIKHNNDFLSAYAHNRKLIATEGQRVNKGDVIAQMGRSDTDRVKLHFEIRKQGKPVDPMRYLPRR